jgi:halimadienyl-diphosphate synthase
LNENLISLLDSIGHSEMLTTAYDTAWVARLTEFDRELGLAAIEWLCENQLPDGSWGAGQAYYYHDRVICTLSAMIALTKCGRRQSDKRAIEKGLLALEDITTNATKGLSAALKGLTIGFEMIVPTLVIEAESLGIIKQQKERILGRISQQRAQKLSRLQGKMINRHLTIAFSSEMVGIDNQHMLDIENLQEQNGSVGCSPSATAYFALQVKREDQKAMEYLYRSRRENGGAPNVAPFDVFEISWTLWNLSLIPSLHVSEKIRSHLDFLSDTWRTGRGIGFASEYSVRDSDVTSLVFDTLARFGRVKDIESVLNYEEAEWFRCYELESNPSVSANIHVIGALRAAGFEQSHPSVQKAIRFLKQIKAENPFWEDKWHYSPFYATAHAVIVSAGYVDNLVKESVDWLVSSQNQDGSWGAYLPTCEETAYVIQALWSWNQKAGKIPTEILRKGGQWLTENQNAACPPLWIGKCLYNPVFVLQSAIISAIALVNEL